MNGKVAILTGGASGIGRALAEELARRGAHVVLADRQIELARSVEAEIGGRGGRASSVELDVRDRGAFERVVRDTARAHGRVDFLFNNAGIAVGGEMDRYDPEDYDDVYDVNLRGVSYGIHAAYPVMIRQGFGHIVNTASVAGLVVAPGNGSYAASKHAVVALSKGLRMEGRRHGVRASVLCPGAIRTPILVGGRYGRSKVSLTEEAILEMWERVRPMAADVFAKKAVARILANDAIIVIPRWWKALWMIDRISPSLAMTLFGRYHETTLRPDLEPSTPMATRRTANNAAN